MKKLASSIMTVYTMIILPYTFSPKCNNCHSFFSFSTPSFPLFLPSFLPSSSSFFFLCLIYWMLITSSSLNSGRSINLFSVYSNTLVEPLPEALWKRVHWRGCLFCSLACLNSLFSTLMPVGSLIRYKVMLEITSLWKF